MYIHMLVSMWNGIKVHYVLAISILLFLIVLPVFSAACSEDWKCFEWQKCSENTTTRQCFDVNLCGTSYLKPHTSEDCITIFPYCYNNILDNDETDIDCGGTCMPCDKGKFCLDNIDCSTLYCLNGRCSTKPIEQPAIKVVSPSYAYILFFLLIVSLIIIVIMIIQAEKFIPILQKNEFNLELSESMQKARKGDLVKKETELETGIPSRKEKDAKEQLKQLGKKEKKEAEKWLKLADSSARLPEEKKATNFSEAKKRRILKDIKTVYEYSYE